jgi:hypothetical protein
MRTTLHIDDDPLAAAVAGFVPFPAKPGVVTTNEQVDALRDVEGL